jgi:hypothetical protein
LVILHSPSQNGPLDPLRDWFVNNPSIAIRQSVVRFLQMWRSSHIELRREKAEEFNARMGRSSLGPLTIHQ